MNSSGRPSMLSLYLRSCLYWLGMIVSALLIGTATLLMFPFNVDQRFLVAQTWARFNLWSIKAICGLDYRIEGEKQFPQEGSITMCKHQSTWETLMLQMELPSVRWVLKRELLRIPFFGWGLAMLRPIAIDRSAGRKAVRQLVEQGKTILDAGYWVIIFPEGTRTRPGKRGRYKIGGAVLAAESGHPVVPVAHNAGEFWPRHSFIKWPGTITVCFGPPIETRGKTPEQVITEVEGWIEGKMREISDPARWER